VLAAARAGAERRVVAVVEPHRYTRVQSLFEEFSACFKDADHVIVAPLYSAGEPPIDGIDGRSLAAGIARAGHRSVVAVDTPQDLVPALRNLAGPGDMVICMGAGNSTDWAHALPGWLAAIPLRVGSAV
jgi:UDP-N-acetylmuramate--alanine ligase